MEVIIQKMNHISLEAMEKQIKDIAKETELIIIFGKKQNEDTNRMYNISLKECGNAIIIETMEDLYLNYIKRFKKVGVVDVGGIPQSQIEKIMNILKHTQVEGYIYEHFK